MGTISGVSNKLRTLEHNGYIAKKVQWRTMGGERDAFPVLSDTRENLITELLPLYPIPCTVPDMAQCNTV